MGNKKTFIYGLYDINDPNKKIRYIGKADDPNYRLKRHKNNTVYNNKKGVKLTHKEYWIISCDYNIDYKILMECYGDTWRENEKKLINEYTDLTNTSSGGMGGSGVKYHISYDECKKWVKEHTNIKSKTQWSNNIDKLDEHIPKYPRQRYLNDGWVSWGDFLGTGKISDNYVNYLSYDDAKKVIHELNLKKVVQYKEIVKRHGIPNNIPNRPDRYYLNRGWVSWSDFLGCEIIANQNKKFYPLEVFKTKLRDLGIKTTVQYKNYCLSDEKDINMPSYPISHYNRTNRGIKWLDFVS